MRDETFTEVDRVLMEQEHQEELEEVEYRAEERVDRALRQYRGPVTASLMIAGALSALAAHQLYHQDVSGCIEAAVGALICYGVSRLIRRYWRGIEVRIEVREEQEDEA